MYFTATWRKCCPIIGQKYCFREFLVFASFNRSMTIVAKRVHVLSAPKVQMCVKNKPANNQNFLTRFIRQKCHKSMFIAFSRSNS